MPHVTVPQPHPVRSRPWLALVLGVAAVVVVVLAGATPAGSAPAEAPVDAGCMVVDVAWDGDVVASIDVEVLEADEGVAPRVTAQVLGPDNASLWREQVTGQSVISWAPGVGPASVVIVEEGWLPGALCRVLVNAPDVEPDSTGELDAPAPPEYAPPAPPAGEHRPDQAPAPLAPAGGEPVTRTLHSR